MFNLNLFIAVVFINMNDLYNIEHYILIYIHWFGIVEIVTIYRNIVIWLVGYMYASRKYR